IYISAVLPTATQPRSRILNRNRTDGEWTQKKALQLRFQIIGSFVIQVALALPLLSTSAVAFEQTVPGALESYAEAVQLFLRSVQDASPPKVESQFETNSRFDAKKFSAFDGGKESNKVNFGLVSVTTSFTNLKTLFGAGPPTEMRHDQTIALDLTGLQSQT